MEESKDTEPKTPVREKKQVTGPPPLKRKLRRCLACETDNLSQRRHIGGCILDIGETDEDLYEN